MWTPLYDSKTQSFQTRTSPWRALWLLRAQNLFLTEKEHAWRCAYFLIFFYLHMFAKQWAPILFCDVHKSFVLVIVISDYFRLHQSKGSFSSLMALKKTHFSFFKQTYSCFLYSDLVSVKKSSFKTDRCTPLSSN